MQPSHAVSAGCSILQCVLRAADLFLLGEDSKMHAAGRNGRNAARRYNLVQVLG